MLLIDFQFSTFKNAQKRKKQLNIQSHKNSSTQIFIGPQEQFTFRGASWLPINPQRFRAQEKEGDAQIRRHYVFSRKMPREVIQNLIIFILLIITPHIITKIFETVLKRRSFNQQIQKYTLKEIVHVGEANLMIERILKKIENAPNLDKIWKKNWKFTELKIDLEILHQKIKKWSKERKQI